MAAARDVVPEPGADLQTVCSGEPELFSAAPRVVEEHCLDEKPSAETPAGGRRLRLDDSALALVEAPGGPVRHCLDVRVSALEPAQAVTVLVQAESVQVSHGSEPVGSAPPEFFPVCPYGLCSFRQDARWPLHRGVHG